MGVQPNGDPRPSGGHPTGYSVSYPVSCSADRSISRSDDHSANHSADGSADRSTDGSADGSTGRLTDSLTDRSVGYSVGEVSRFAKVTVRTLHHYDEIGLLSPSGRTAAGYRRYSDADLDRLQLIRYYRELDFPLEEIAAIIDDPDADPAEHLRRQHGLLTERIERLRAMVSAIEHAMTARTMGISLTPEERFEVFGDHDPERYADEARERWGDTPAYRQSRERAGRYRKADWLLIKAEAAEITDGLVAAMRAGEPADSRSAMDCAERHRQHIGRWFYDCDYEIHCGLAAMYLADARFTATYETIAAGLARYVHDAIMANARRAATS